MTERCRHCENYHPDERYAGAMGWCDIKKCPRTVDGFCLSFKVGEQTWLLGKKVK